MSLLQDRAGSAEDESVDTEDRYMIISGDSHVGPSLQNQLRQYCPSQYLEAFDEFARNAKSEEGISLEKRFTDFATDATRRAYIRSSTCPGLQDPQVFLRDMDSDGVAASVIFAGGGNNEPVPWLGGLIPTAGTAPSSELAEVGARIFNQWLADFVSLDPHRLLGVAQIPLGSMESAVREVHWAYEHGLRALNFPAPRSDLLPYNNLIYEPFWDAVEETGLPLVTHGASGEPPNAPEGHPGYFRIFGSETMWLSRRGLSHLIFGGVFERHPGVKIVFTEQRNDWIGETLDLLDSIYFDPTRTAPEDLPRRPSEYWKTNCYVAGSFMAPYEAARRHEGGIENLLWGTDYPHPEGTWPRTMLALRNTFNSIPVDDVRKILGENAIPVFNIDRAEMREIADRIGPTPEEVAKPLSPDEFPEHRGWAFRKLGAYG